MHAGSHFQGLSAESFDGRRGGLGGGGPGVGARSRGAGVGAGHGGAGGRRARGGGGGGLGLGGRSRSGGVRLVGRGGLVGIVSTAGAEQEQSRQRDDAQNVQACMGLLFRFVHGLTKPFSCGG